MRTLRDVRRLATAVRALLPPAPYHGPFRVEVEDDAASFRRKAARDGAWRAAAYYCPRQRAVFLPPAYPDGTLTHEVVHAVMDVDWGCTGPLWFAEGTAEALAYRHAHGAWPPAAPLCPGVLPREAMYGPAFATHYGAARAHVSFLLQHDRARYEALLRGRA